MNARTFRIGGVHPEENKLTHEAPTQVAALPKQAIYPLSQHIGAPAKPVVMKGDKVKVNDPVAIVEAMKILYPGFSPIPDNAPLADRLTYFVRLVVNSGNWVHNRSAYPVAD